MHARCMLDAISCRADDGRLALECTRLQECARGLGSRPTTTELALRVCGAVRRCLYRLCGPVSLSRPAALSEGVRLAQGAISVHVVLGPLIPTQACWTGFLHCNGAHGDRDWKGPWRPHRAAGFGTPATHSALSGLSPPTGNATGWQRCAPTVAHARPLGGPCRHVVDHWIIALIERMGPLSWQHVPHRLGIGLHTTPLFGGRLGRATDKTPYWRPIRKPKRHCDAPSSTLSILRIIQVAPILCPHM